MLATPAARTAQAAWTVRDRTATDAAGSEPVATTTEQGHVLDLHADATGTVWLVLRPPSTSRMLTSQCPTLQIDRLTPLIHPPLGNGCTVEPTTATLQLGRQSARQVVSKTIYALVNGKQLAVRYLAEDQQYHETLFSLRHSKRAVKRALGGRRIRP